MEESLLKSVIIETEKALRIEVIETQKARSALLKWKLLLVAGVGSVGLGFSMKGSNNLKIDAELVLCLIPFLCSYVDLLCSNLNLRLITIGTYLCRVCKDPYEEFVSKLRSVFSLEDWALYGSSIIISSAVFLYGMQGILYELHGEEKKLDLNDVFDIVLGKEFVLSLSGIIGITLVLLVRMIYTNKLKDVEKISKLIEMPKHNINNL